MASRNVIQAAANFGPFSEARWAPTELPGSDLAPDCALRERNIDENTRRFSQYIFRTAGRGRHGVKTKLTADKQRIVRYASRHRAAAKYVLPRVLGFSVDGSDADFHAVGQHMPFVRFIPRAEDRGRTALS
jgi:hypothetical protein